MKKLIPVLVLVIALFCSACGTANRDAATTADQANDEAAVVETGYQEDAASSILPNITGRFVGNFKDQNVTRDVNARIQGGNDGYTMDLDVAKVGTVSDISVYYENGRLYFKGTDPNNVPLVGYLKYENNQLSVIFTDAKWDVFVDGSEMYLEKTE